MHRVNIGCGQTPTPSWKNFDNSLSVRLAEIPALVWLLEAFGLVNSGQKDMIRFCQKNEILWADACRRIPLPDHSAEVLYTSHMLEHLDQEDTLRFLKEAQRVLRPDGILRIVVPDIYVQVSRYLSSGDADSFIEGTQLTSPAPRTLLAKVKYLLVGDRNHQWMYDGASLTKLLSRVGFTEARIVSAGSTAIATPGELNLREREDESVCVEACNAAS